MEIDFLGLKAKNTPKKVKEGSRGVYEHSAPRMQWPCSSKLFLPPRFLYSEASKGEDFSLPAQNGCHIQPLFLPEKNSTSPFNHTSSSISNNLPEKNAIADKKLVIATAKCGGSERAFLARPFLNNSSPVNNPTNLRNTASLTVFYSGTIHVFHEIPQEKAEVIMRLAGTNPMTTEAKEVLDQLIGEIKGKSIQHHIPKSSEYSGGGLAMARRATLARFLEKRMHRLLHASPYSLNVGSPESCTSQVKEIGQLL